MEFGFLSMGFVWGGLIALLVGGALAARWSNSRPLAAVPVRSARRLLDERLARGEISLDEYERIVAHLLARSRD